MRTTPVIIQYPDHFVLELPTNRPHSEAKRFHYLLNKVLPTAIHLPGLKYKFRDGVYDITQVQLLCSEFYGAPASLQHFEPEVNPNDPITLVVEWLGNCKRRPEKRNPWTQFTMQDFHDDYDKQSYATAYVNGAWSVIFSEQVLRDYFKSEERFNGDFLALLLKSNDLAKDYKKLALKYHPDLNRSKDAAKMFHKLKSAYDVLKDPMRRKRYEAGLKFAMATPEQLPSYRAPVKCGRFVVVGEYETVSGHRRQKYNPTSQQWTDGGSPDFVQQLRVSKIISVEDIYNSKGQVMTTELDRTTVKPIIQWIDNTDFVVVV